jgi:YD repeat-containing protein
MTWLHDSSWLRIRRATAFFAHTGLLNSISSGSAFSLSTCAPLVGGRKWQRCPICGVRIVDTAPPGVSFTAFSTGGIGDGAGHTLALAADGTVWAWGYNGYGQLGNGTTSDSSTPVHVCASGQSAPCSAFLTGVTAIATGSYHSLALDSSGKVWAWGYNASGQLGNGTTTDSHVPVQVSSLGAGASLGSGTDSSSSFARATPGATTTTVTSSVNPSVTGQAVTFTAKVVASGGGTGTPTGTVTFSDGTTTLGAGTLSAGTATYTTNSLSVGSHSITAVYGGDTTFVASTSSALTQMVN